MKEQFRPVSHHPPVGVINSVIFYCRLAVDFQMCTIFRQLKNIIPDFRGKILDIGCGNSPFKFLVDTSKASYIGIDIEDAGNFNYNNPDKINYDGENLPFENESLENIISTEVLEHIEKPEKIIDEMYRVLKPGGNVVITIPWSARVYYAPYDFCRYTPFKLKKLFSRFQKIEILSRGSDINSIIAKMIVLFARTGVNSFKIRILLAGCLFVFKLIFLVLSLPILILAIGIAHLELFLKTGSDCDPLGYTVILKK